MDTDANNIAAGWGALQSQDPVAVDQLTPQPQSLILAQTLRPDQRPAAVYLSRLAPGSRRTMHASLNLIASLLTAYKADMHSLNWGGLRYQHTAALRRLLADLYAPSTANKMLAALRGVLKEAWRLGYMTAEEYHRAADLPSIRGATLLRGRALTQDELARLFTACTADPGPSGKRDAALLAILYNCGLRRSEAVALDLADYEPQSGALRVRSGKGNKARVGYAAGPSLLAISEWLVVRGKGPGPLFCPINKAGRLARRRLSDQAVRKILNKRGAEAGVAPFSPHDLRRTMIGDLLTAGADIATVQKLVGHANVGTTARYDRRGEAAKREAAQLLQVPYSGERKDSPENGG